MKPHIAASRDTSVTLLARLGRDPSDNRAWQQFVDRYGPRLTAWCAHWGLQPADAQDVTQTVLVRLAVKLRTFRYDPSKSFRAWLKTVARNAWSDFVADRQRHARTAGGSAAEAALMSVPAGEDLQRRMEEAFDLELLDLATHAVRGRVAARTWDAFRITSLEGRPVADAAAELDMSVLAVFKAKSNVIKMLRETLAALDANQGKPSP